MTRKITRALARIKLGLQDKLYLGNLDAKRDWGYAGDYVKAMWLMLQQDKPDDYVIATGETHSVREFLDEAAPLLDLDWHPYVEIDPRYYRPTEVDLLLGDSSKARRELGWEPQVTFKTLVHMMVHADYEAEANPAGHAAGVPDPPAINPGRLPVPVFRSFFYLKTSWFWIRQRVSRTGYRDSSGRRGVGGIGAGRRRLKRACARCSGDARDDGRSSQPSPADLSVRP